MRRSWSATLLVVVACAAIVSCGQRRRAAEAGIKMAERVVGTASHDVGLYAADQWREITDALASAKDHYAKREYDEAIASIKDIGTKVQAAQLAAASRKTQLEAEWTALTASVPPMIASAKEQVDKLGSLKKLPKGVEKATVDGAKQAVAAAEGAWKEADETFRQSNVELAVKKGNAVKEKAVEILRNLGVEAGVVPAKTSS